MHEVKLPTPSATKKVAIIGSAGRNEDAKKMSKELFEAMVTKADRMITSVFKLDKSKVILVSGGSAFADHVAIRLFLNGQFGGLELYLPCDFKTDSFTESSKEGVYLNKLHTSFSKVVGINSLMDVAKVKTLGARLTVSKGFHARNTEVAKSPFLIAFTFSPGKVPKTGSGTSDTWKKCVGMRLHVSLSSLTSTSKGFLTKFLVKRKEPPISNSGQDKEPAQKRPRT